MFHPRKLLLLLLLPLLLIVAGCGTKKATGPKKVAVIVSTLNNPWFVVLAETAAAMPSSEQYEVAVRELDAAEAALA